MLVPHVGIFSRDWRCQQWCVLEVANGSNPRCFKRTGIDHHFYKHMKGNVINMWSRINQLMRVSS